MQEKEEKTNKKINWGPTILSIIIGIMVTVGTTWYTIYSSKQESEKAEKERFDKVKENLVSIIEEHIVNKDSIDLNSFNRLINNRTKEESLYKRPSIYDLLTQSEFNIQNSKHLSFDKKLEYSKIVATLYSGIVSDTTISISNNRFPEETSNVLNLINETNKNEGKKNLSVLIEKYENEIIDLQSKQLKKESIVDYVLKSPSTILSISISYVFITILYLYYIRMRRRKRKQLELFEERSSFEREKIKSEIDSLLEILNNDDTSSEDRKFFEERLDNLFRKLKETDNYYSQHSI